MKGKRLRAKGKKIVFDTEDGEQTYNLRPMKNKQLLEVMNKAEEGKDKPDKAMESAFLMAKYTLNNDLNEEDKFTDDDIQEMDVCFLMPLLKESSEINGLGDMFDFQKGVAKSLPDQNQSSQTKSDQNISVVDKLNQNPKQVLS